jgi:hypothetical protein
MAGILALIPSITEALIAGAVVASSVALNEIADDAAARGDPQPEPEYEGAAYEATGFEPGAEPQAAGTVSKLEPLNDADDDFSTMVLAAIPKPKPIPGGPVTQKRKPTKKIGILQETAAKVAHKAVKAAIDYLTDLTDTGDQMATLIDFLNQADAALLVTKAGVDWQSIVDKVTGANNQLVNFLKQMSDTTWITQHLSASIDPKLLQAGITAWKVFTQVLGSTA